MQGETAWGLVLKDTDIESADLRDVSRNRARHRRP